MAAHLDTLRDQQLIKFSVFSMFKPCETMDDAAVLDAFKKRFCKTLPMEYVDCVIVHSIDEAEKRVERPITTLNDNSRHSEMDLT